MTGVGDTPRDFASHVRETNRRLQALERRKIGAGVSQVQPGMITAWGGTGAPPGWFFCDGSAVSRSQYADLFATIGTTYGAGNGTTTFNLPDLRGRVPVGKSTDTEFLTLGQTGGEKAHTLTINEMPSHSHQWQAAGTSNAASTANWDDIVGGNQSPLGTGPATAEDAPNNAIKPRGGGAAHNIIQPYLTVNYIIAYSSGSGGVTIEVLANQGNTAQRNAQFGIPTSAAQQAALANQQIMWMNTDWGWIESYYAPAGTSGLTVLGLETVVPAGWYPTGPGPSLEIEPSTTFAATSGNYVGNWNGTSRRRGGATFLNADASGILIGVPGIYDFGWWTNQTTGSSQADYHTRINNNTDTAVDWMSNLSISPLTSFYVRVGGDYRDVFIRPNSGRLRVLCSTGSLTVHMVTGGTTYPSMRGQMYARWVRPALQTD